MLETVQRTANDEERPSLADQLDGRRQGAAQGGSLPMLGGIVLTYGVVQFIQGWVLEPLIVGPQVKINSFQLPPAKAGVKMINPENMDELVQLLHSVAKVI